MCKRLILGFTALLLTLSAAGQLVTSGEEPANVRWNAISTANYKIIYPRGTDSLAIQYAKELEKYRGPVGVSSGFLPGEQYRAKTPVILHTYNGVANGSVTWTPKRMEFYTLPSAIHPDPMPWITNLAIHESRHLSQMQFGYKGWLFKPLSWILGEMSPGAAVAVYPGQHILEGDAVVAETALTDMGRGRNADFLNYYRVAWPSGDFRSFYEWLYGSYKKYTPSHYPFGYTLIAGARVFQDDPLFTKEYFDRINRRPIGFNYLKKQTKSLNGMKPKTFYNYVMYNFMEEWAEDDKARGQFVEPELITTKKTRGWFVEYNWVMSQSQDSVYAVRSGLREPNMLVKIDSLGRERKICQVSYNASGFTLAGNRIYWSEVLPSARWGFKSTVAIRYIDLKTKWKHTLIRDGRLFNPSVNGSEEILSATDFPAEGGSAVVVLNTASGEQLCRYPAPDSLQIVESAWLGPRLFVSGISNCGIGLYEIRDGGFVESLAPAPRALHTLYAEDNQLRFTSDRTGVDEIYAYDPDTKILLQQTSTKTGVKSSKSKDMIVTYLSKDSRGVYKIDSLLNREVTPSAVSPFRVADVLTEQERQLGAIPAADQEFEILPPKPYRKAANLFKIHSWAPMCFKMDEIDQLSFSDTYNSANIGATALFQNEMGTTYGYLGYSYAPGNKTAPHGGYIDLTYSGFYPVFNFKLDVNHRQAFQYNRNKVYFGSVGMSQVSSHNLDMPSISASAEVYIPFNLSSDGWVRGVVPRLRWAATNDYYAKTVTKLKLHNGMTGLQPLDFVGADLDDNVPIQTVTTSIRAYSVREKASRQVFPRFGIGAEVGYNERIGMSEYYSPSFYMMVYGYLPGLLPQQGLKFMATAQDLRKRSNMTAGESYLFLLPRGFVSDDLAFLNNISALYDTHLLCTAEYAIPIGILSFYNRILSVRNLEAILHFDYGSYYSIDREDANLTSSGFSLAAVCPNFFWIPYETKIGASLSFNGGDYYEKKKGEFHLNPFYVGGIFTISF